jgi:hypothetical protein
MSGPISGLMLVGLMLGLMLGLMPALITGMWHLRVPW